MITGDGSDWNKAKQNFNLEKEVKASNFGFIAMIVP
jgi:hypothetical protein